MIELYRANVRLKLKRDPKGQKPPVGFTSISSSIVYVMAVSYQEVEEKVKVWWDSVIEETPGGPENLDSRFIASIAKVKDPFIT